MAIQIRRGASEDFDATKMVSGELAVATDDTHKVWATGQAGDCWELASKENLDAEEEARETLEETVDTLVTDVDGKANKDGYYPSLYAGNLASTRKQTDTAPYLMRKTGGDLSRVGEREDDTIVGATVRANQIVPISSSSRSTTIQGVTFVDNRDGSYTFYTDENGASANAIFSIINKIDGGSPQHVYYLKGNAEGSSISTWYLTDQYNGVFDYDFKKENIVKVLKDTPARLDLRVVVASGTVISVPVTIKPQVIDLTAYLGSTIADYLYNLETATAGSGIAKLREWGFFTDEYIPYNPGSLESVEARSHVMRGFNQWDEEWEVGAYNTTTGAKVSDSARIRSKNLIPILPDTAYYFKFPYAIGSFGFSLLYYDADGNYISGGLKYGTLHTTPSDSRFIAFYTQGTYGTTYNNDICINLSNPDRNGEYEPYTEQTYDYGDDTLNGIFKLDANNNLYADGDRKTSDGMITRKYGLVDLGSQTWTKSIDGVFTTTGLVGQVKEPATYNANPNLVCSKYLSASYAELWSDAKDKTVTVIWSASGSHGQVLVRDSAYTDASTFATAMSGTYLVYPLATPTTEQSTPFTNPQICDPDGTEEYVTNNGVPVGHETEYDYDIKGLAEELIDVPDVPSSNGTYVLKATRSASGISYEWVEETTTASTTSSAEAGDTV